MKLVRTLLVFPLVVLMMASSSAFAGQQHLVNPSQLAAAVADDAAKQDTNRAIVREALERPEVQSRRCPAPISTRPPTPRSR
jgi:hypothetical protein